jgi:hypothetical protein
MLRPIYPSPPDHNEQGKSRHIQSGEHKNFQPRRVTNPCSPFILSYNDFTRSYASVEWTVDCSWNVMVHGDAQETKWRGNWRMEWVASTLHTTSKHGVSSITTADAHTSAAISRLNWRPRLFNWTRPFRRKTKSGLYACAITFQQASNYYDIASGITNQQFCTIQCIAPHNSCANRVDIQLYEWRVTKKK